MVSSFFNCCFVCFPSPLDQSLEGVSLLSLQLILKQLVCVILLLTKLHDAASHTGLPVCTSSDSAHHIGSQMAQSSSSQFSMGRRWWCPWFLLHVGKGSLVLTSSCVSQNPWVI